MLFFFLAAVTLAANGSAADLPSESTHRIHAEQELERVRQQAAAGLLPTAQIADAQSDVDDCIDEEILDRTLYGHLQVEDLNEQQATDMVSAAERRASRVEKKAERGRTLIANKVAEPFMFADVEAELAQRLKVVEEAKARASLIVEMAAMANAEAAATEPRVAHVGKRPREVHVDGDHLLEPEDVKAITLAFEKEFHEPFPVSARGATAVHRAMGFDHTGRIDVALTPDSREGVWLRKYLEAKSIPYYAFRTAIAGKATAAHIHIGPGSTRIHAD